MSYATIATIRQDAWLRDRASACVATETGSNTPEEWVMAHAWALAAQPGWAEAWESALATHVDAEDYKPGEDPSVVTDAMILSAVQTIMQAESSVTGD